MIPEEITFQMRQLHDRVLVCPGCHRILLPSDRGWRCDRPGHHTGFDSDELAAAMLQRKSSGTIIQCLRIVRQYRKFAAGKNREERAAIFARPTETKSVETKTVVTKTVVTKSVVNTIGE